MKSPSLWKSEIGIQNYEYPEFNLQVHVVEAYAERGKEIRSNYNGSRKEKNRGPTRIKKKFETKRIEQIGKLIIPNGLDMSKLYILDTQQTEKAKYKKWRWILLQAVKEFGTV
ncbi:hypothetical protein Tco_1064055 [Tanacetum coccineum]